MNEPPPFVPEDVRIGPSGPFAPAPAPASDELVKVSNADTTAGFLFAKVNAGAGIITDIFDPGLNEQLRITSRFQILRAGWAVVEPQALAANLAGVFDPVVGATFNFTTWADVDGNNFGVLRGKWCASVQLAAGLAPTVIFRVQVSVDAGATWHAIRNVVTPTCFQESRWDHGATAAMQVFFHFAVNIVAPASPPRVRIVYNAPDGATLLASGAHMLEAEEITFGIVNSFPNTELEP